MITARALARRAVSAAAYYSGLEEQRHRVAMQDRGVVLMYHRVLSDAPHPGVDPGMFVTASAFEHHLRLLRSRYDLVTIDAFGEWMTGQRVLTRPPCAITFDDGWRDNYDVAFPLLQRYGATATVFLVTSWIGRDDMLDADRIARMESSGIAFGSHTVTHALLGQVDRQTMQSELADSRTALDRFVQRPSRWFCFPKGSHTREACDLVRQFYDGAVTVRRGWVDRKDDRFTLKRVGVHNDVAGTAAMLASRITFLR
jgi:peptidoglycan/xylan/chitin deacetylase (PgdA/CDA1 family)